MGLTHFPNGVSSFGVPQLGGGGLIPDTTGTYFFVDDGGSNANDGLDPDHPFADLDYAIGQTTASVGDVIIIMPGHAETRTAVITVDVIGITIVGLGSGDARPAFTINAALMGGIDVTADDVTISNIRIITGASITIASRLLRVAASDVNIVNCQLEMTDGNQIYNMAVVISGDNIIIENCRFFNSQATQTAERAQSAILAAGGTNVHVRNCYFNDMAADKNERWEEVVRGGVLGSDLVVEDCTFVIRGIATAERSGSGVSSEMCTIYCRCISPSANTALNSNFTNTYQYLLESYNVAAVNKNSIIAASSSDKRLKRSIAYL